MEHYPVTYIAPVYTATAEMSRHPDGDEDDALRESENAYEAARFAEKSRKDSRASVLSWHFSYEQIDMDLKRPGSGFKLECHPATSKALFLLLRLLFLPLPLFFLSLDPAVHKARLTRLRWLMKISSRDLLRLQSYWSTIFELTAPLMNIM